MMDNRKPFIYKTTDFGQTWTNITGDLPSAHPLDYVLSVAENPNRKGMLFAGTGHNFFYSLDDGAHWKQFNEGTAAQRRVVDHRSQAMARRHRVHIRPRHFHSARHRAARADRADRRRRRDALSAASWISTGRSGRADITFALKTVSPRPARIEIVDSANKVVRTLQAPTRAGFNRATWDLRYDPPRVVALRTPAPDNARIFEEPRFRNRPTRPITHWGIQGAQTSGPLALPGKYTVRLIVNGKTESQPLTILKDPDIKTVDADLVASAQAQVRVRDNLNTTADMVKSSR
jgi:hypothetical protein